MLKESGTSVKKQTRISHKGNSYINKTLHYPDNPSDWDDQREGLIALPLT